MIETITEPGVYQGIPNRDYHLQLTPTPSMSASMAVKIIDECPKKLWHGCYLNPAHEREERTIFDLGSAAHLALLEPDDWSARTAIIAGFDDFKKKEARELRDAAYASGKTPLLEKHVAKIMGLRDACLADEDVADVFTHGKAEQTVVARDPQTGVWLKCRPDKAADDWSWIADLKTTTDANPLFLPRKANNDAWARRAEWYLDVVELAVGIRPAQFFFIAAEIDEPHVATAARFKPRLAEKPRALEWASLMNRAAIDRFAECVSTNTWPKYASGIVDIDLPPYAEMQLEERHAAGEFTRKKPSAALLQRSLEMQAP